jgi:hypothetical protein
MGYEALNMLGIIQVSIAFIMNNLSSNRLYYFFLDQIDEKVNLLRKLRVFNLCLR